MSLARYFIGLLSGTSIDGIDCVLVDFSQELPHLVASHSEPIPEQLRTSLLRLCSAQSVSLLELGETDIALGRLFAQAVNAILHKNRLSKDDIIAIGSHGQTIQHQPNGFAPFTIQIGDPNTICELTGISTVADFRRKDMAAGGQGAPLAPTFHQYRFANSTHRRAVLNIGGISNITLLSQADSHQLTGFDTGPGNVLMDTWIKRHKGASYDQDGVWATTGELVPALLDALLADPYFNLPAPKSTGRELFNEDWLQKHLDRLGSLSPNDVQATLLELTARSIVESVDWKTQDIKELVVCGGGVHNGALMRRLAALVRSCEVVSSESLGLSPDWVEGVAFAWFAYKTWNNEPINTGLVTGAKHPCLLGGIYHSESRV
jgi:anhydro-N-acetylmuramic acid kinase